MNLTPKTIQIFLPSGDPQGIRVAEITTRILQVIEVPRSLLKQFSEMPESNQVALYFLFGEDDQAEQRVYIGQTGDLKTRLNSHNNNKDFWERALMVISRTNSLTQTHGLFLEWYCIDKCREAGRYVDEYGNRGSKPYTPAPLEADCLEIYDTTKTLLSTLGYPLFAPLVKPQEEGEEIELFYCTGSGADGRGQYTAEGFVVLEGSTARIGTTASFQGTSHEKMRSRLIETGVLAENSETLEFQKNHLFKSPSAAAVVLTGGISNGWLAWKDEQGRTLDELKRKMEET